jgi:hypothetical protein
LKKNLISEEVYWQLDYTFKDDRNTTMKRNGAKNLQIIGNIREIFLALGDTTVIFITMFVFMPLGILDLFGN